MPKIFFLILSLLLKIIFKMLGYMYISQKVAKIVQKHPICSSSNLCPLLLQSYLTMAHRPKLRTNIGSLLLTKLWPVFHQFFHYCSFLFQRQIQNYVFALYGLKIRLYLCLGSSWWLHYNKVLLLGFDDHVWIYIMPNNNFIAPD